MLEEGGEKLVKRSVRKTRNPPQDTATDPSRLWALSSPAGKIELKSKLHCPSSWMEYIFSTIRGTEMCVGAAKILLKHHSNFSSLSCSGISEVKVRTGMTLSSSLGGFTKH